MEERCQVDDGGQCGRWVLYSGEVCVVLGGSGCCTRGRWVSYSGQVSVVLGGGGCCTQGRCNFSSRLLFTSSFAIFFNLDYTLRKHDRSIRHVEEVDSGNRTLEDVPCNSGKTHEHSEKKPSRKPSFKQETCFSFSQHDPITRMRKSSAGSHGRSSTCVPGLAENIVAEHQSGTVIVGSLDTWAKNNGSDVLLSSTPEGYEGTHAFMGDITVNDESADVALHARTKEEHGSTATSNQVTYEYSAGS